MSPAGWPAGDDRGGVPIELALGVGLLLLPVALLVLSFPTWVERQSMARLAARESARTVALSASMAEGVAAGEALAQQIAVNHGVDPADLSVRFSGSVDRTASVTATVTVAFPAVEVPGFGGAGAVRWTTTHTEKVDRYRSLP